MQWPYPMLRHTLTNGTKVVLVQRRGMQRSLALWTVPFGSLHQHLPGPERNTVLPAGVAHFLEHQLFREEDGSSISDKFAALGVQENAFTYFQQTGYHFSGTTHFPQALKLLLDFTAHPSFTDDSVERERDIINQELMMYRDMPAAVLEVQQRRALFEGHPAAEDIGGTPESIAEVTPTLLQQCHAQFYHPSEALLVVVGDFAMDELVALCEATDQRKVAMPAQATSELLPAGGKPVHQRLCSEMNVPRTMLSMAIKEPHPISSGRLLMQRQLESEMMLQLLLGKTSAHYWRLYSEGLINSTFSVDYQGSESFAYARFGGESDRPEELIDALRSIVFSGNHVFRAEDVERMKKRILGECISGFEGFENLAFDLSLFELSRTDVFALPDILGSISHESLHQRAEEFLCEEQLALSLVVPLQSE